MKTKLANKIKFASIVLSLAAFVPVGYAQLTIPYANGSDGALNITTNTVIDLSQAVSGVWTNTSASPGNGTYDLTQWAIVFKYSSVNIASNTVVTFINHYSRAPVVWLVSGNVTINGELNLDGQPTTYGANEELAEPGPGGFRGGAYSSIFGGGNGLGPAPGNYSGYYGTTNIVPLIGGSGAASPGYTRSGGGGGGAILIAASGSITVYGYFHANGGSSDLSGGSGGGLRLVANQILGNGSLSAVGGINAGSGKIRLEANSVASTLAMNPSTAGLQPANPPVIFPPANWPTVTVLSVAGLAAPADPKAIMSPSTGADDLAIATVNPVTIQVQTKNFPTNGTVNVYVTPRIGAASILPASFVSGNTNQAIWQVSATLPYPTANQGHTIIMARAVAP